MQLNQEQIEQFHEAGYVVLPAVFQPDEIERMADEARKILHVCINTCLALGLPDRRVNIHLRQGRLALRKIQPINDLSDYLKAVSEDERLLEPMRQLLNGAEPLLMEEKLNYKQVLPADLDPTPFKVDPTEDLFILHNDWGYYRMQNYPQETLSSAISIDESTAENGPIRVVPGTHKKDWPYLFPDPKIGRGDVPEELFDESQRIPILAPAGSVMLFHSKLLHDSTPNRTNRPRRIMIYSHYPSWHEAAPDQRNGAFRQRGQELENQYRAMVARGQYHDRAIKEGV